MSRGVGHLKACPRGLEGIIDACPGGRNKIEACTGTFTSLSGGGGGGGEGVSRYNISLSRVAFIYCPGGGDTFAIFGICRDVGLNNGIAQSRLRPGGKGRGAGRGSHVTMIGAGLVRAVVRPGVTDRLGGP